MKNNLLKRIAAAAFTAATVLTCMPTTAMAAGELPTIDANKPVNLTITKYVAGNGDSMELDSAVTGKEVQQNVNKTPLAGVTFTAIEVADLVQDVATDNQNISLAYKLTDNGATVLNATKGTNTSENFTANAIVTGETLNKYIKDRKAADYDGKLANITTKAEATTGKDGVVKFSSANVSGAVNLTGGQGLYLIVETAAPAEVTVRSHPFFVSLPMTDKENENQWQYDVFAYPKNSTATTNIDKKITEVNNNKNNGIASENHSAEAQIGDVITYQVPVTALIPDGGLTKLEIQDVMSKGLTLQIAGQQVAASDIDVYTGDSIDPHKKVDSQEYTATAQTDPQTGNTTLTVAFTKDYLNTLNAGVDKNPHFLFVYKATLNQDAVLGQTGNGNTVTGNYGYANNPDVVIGEASTKVYTWGIDLTKQGEDTATKLQNVEFTLKKDNTELKFTKRNDGAYVPAENGDSKLTTNKQGKIIIRGLESGTYILTETKPADGYVLLKDAVKIVITGKNTDGSADVTVADNKVTLNKDGNSSNAFVPVTVVNHKGFDLPETGGTGTALFTIAGIAIVAIAAFLLLMRKKTDK